MRFESLEDVQAWADGNGGEAGVRNHIADGKFGSELLALMWAQEYLRDCENKRALARQSELDSLYKQSLSATVAAASASEISANAAMKSANATMWAAFFTLLGAIATLVGAVITWYVAPAAEVKKTDSSETATSRTPGVQAASQPEQLPASHPVKPKAKK